MIRFFCTAISLAFLALSPWPVLAANAVSGAQAYEKTCAACHDGGVAGAPKLDDRSAWQKRLEKGMETLVNHAIDGYQGDSGFMPAKGGNPSLSDAEVEAAVKYMIDQTQ